MHLAIISNIYNKTQKRSAHNSYSAYVLILCMFKIRKCIDGVRLVVERLPIAPTLGACVAYNLRRQAAVVNFSLNNDDVTRIETFIKSAMTCNNIPGLSLAVVDSEHKLLTVGS